MSIQYIQTPLQFQDSDLRALELNDEKYKPLFKLNATKPNADSTSEFTTSLDLFLKTYPNKDISRYVSKGETILNHVIISQHFDLAKLFIEKLKDLGKPEMAARCINNGNSEGLSPFIQAVEHYTKRESDEEYQVIKFFIENGADLFLACPKNQQHSPYNHSLRFKKRDTPLSIACRAKNEKLVKLFQKKILEQVIDNKLSLSTQEKWFNNECLEEKV
ncbi:MAG: hypothetical protein VX777_07090 [Chlamydiota bacterium]|nr:hypothetical protein [Chlamydiota bacterium]